MFKSSTRRQRLAALAGANYGETVRRAALATALALSISSIPAHSAYYTVAVDGNLTDLKSAVASQTAANLIYNSYNVATADDPLGSAELPVTESNNGFDIKTVYAYYNWNVDTLYLGLDVYGTVGNSLTNASALANEGTAINGAGSNSKTIFDVNETYGIQLYRGTTTADPRFVLYNVLGSNTNGTDTLSSTNVVANGLTITQAVSESFNGVEFSIAGLHASGVLGNFSYENPANLLIRFSAGSSDTNTTSTALEDYSLLQMQVVPVPAAAWLFGSGLVGLVAFARKRQQAA